MSAVSQKGPVGIADVRSDQPGDPTDAVPRKWHISVFGGLRRTGRWGAGAPHVVVTAFGNVELDLSQADVEKGLAITVVAILAARASRSREMSASRRTVSRSSGANASTCPNLRRCTGSSICGRSAS